MQQLHNTTTRYHRVVILVPAWSASFKNGCWKCTRKNILQRLQWKHSPCIRVGRMVGGCICPCSNGVEITAVHLTFLERGVFRFSTVLLGFFRSFFLFGSNSLTTTSSACSLADCVRERERGARQETGAGQKAPAQCRSWKEFSRERNKGHGHHYHQWPPLQPRSSCLLLVWGFVLGDERHSTTRRREQ